MIVSQTVPIKVNNRNLSIYKKFNAKIGEIIDSPIHLIPKGSHQKIEVECDICGIRKNLSYQKYILNIKNCGIYSCSSKCAQIKVKKTSLEKFGSEYYTQTHLYKESVNKSSLEKFGETHHLKSKEVRDKISNTNLGRYGTTNVFSSQIIKDKISNTNLEKYGVSNPSKNQEIINNIKNKSLVRWEKIHIEFYKKKNIKIISMLNNGDYEIECGDHSFITSRSLLQNRLSIKTTICTKCHALNSQDSGMEIQLKNWIKSIYSGNILFNDRSIIPPKEIDIFLPDEKIGIEFNGLYWHSEENKDIKYHFLKHKECQLKGVDLIQVWEDDWIYKNDIIKSIILNKISKSERIYARKCEISILSNKDSKEFLLKNHLHGPINSKINIGLRFNNEVVSIMCFNGLRRSVGGSSTEGKYEMTRYCNKKMTSVIGGGSKMLKYFIRNNKFSEIITYYDKSFGYNNSYSKLGFELIGETKPGYHYIIDGVRRHRYNYRKSNLVKMGYDKSKTEKQIMSDLNYLRIFGSGNFKYVFRNDNCPIP